MDGMIHYYMETYDMTYEEAKRKLYKQGYSKLLLEELDKGREEVDYERNNISN